MSLTLHDEITNLMSKYDIKIYNENVRCDAMGIGDILFRFLCIKNKLIDSPFIINLKYFIKPYYGTNPLMQLEFKLKLITDLCKYNNISISSFKFTFSNNNDFNQILPYKFITNFKLDINAGCVSNALEKYIIFHTKCRQHITEDYSLLKKQIQNFCNLFKSKYKIVIMGERRFPENEEVKIHGITTVYDELNYLTHYNIINDISIENIYNNLDYSNYINDVELIKHAEYNICFGLGGQLCTSLIFGKSTLYYTPSDYFTDDYLNQNNHFHYLTAESMFDAINERCSL